MQWTAFQYLNVFYHWSGSGYLPIRIRTKEKKYNPDRKHWIIAPFHLLYPFYELYPSMNGRVWMETLPIITPSHLLYCTTLLPPLVQCTLQWTAEMGWKRTPSHLLYTFYGFICYTKINLYFICRCSCCICRKWRLLTLILKCSFHHKNDIYVWYICQHTHFCVCWKLSTFRIIVVKLFTGIYKNSKFE